MLRLVSSPEVKDITTQKQVFPVTTLVTILKLHIYINQEIQQLMMNFSVMFSKTTLPQMRRKESKFLEKVSLEVLLTKLFKLGTTLVKIKLETISPRISKKFGDNTMSTTREKFILLKLPTSRNHFLVLSMLHSLTSEFQIEIL